MKTTKENMKLEIIRLNKEEYLIIPDGFNLYPIYNQQQKVVLLQIKEAFTDNLDVVMDQFKDSG